MHNNTLDETHGTNPWKSVCGGGGGVVALFWLVIHQAPFHHFQTVLVQLWIEDVKAEFHFLGDLEWFLFSVLDMIPCEPAITFICRGYIIYPISFGQKTLHVSWFWGPTKAWKQRHNFMKQLFLHPIRKKVGIILYVCMYLHMGVSKNSGIPKWMVYNGKPH